MTLRQKMIAVLQQRGEPMTYRDVTDAIWTTFPEHHQHMTDLQGGDTRAARKVERARLGTLVRENPGVFAVTMSDGTVLVGLAATEADEVEDADDEEMDGSTVASPSVYWYTFPAYRLPHGDYPIKIGRGNDPLVRICQQVTAMPENPVVLGTFGHEDPQNLERALHSVLSLRGKRKQDAPGSEWFVTTPDEIRALIDMILGKRD